MGSFGGGKRSSPPPPPPQMWIYDRSGYGAYTIDQGSAIPSGYYSSPGAATAANPKVWSYDKYGQVAEQIFKNDPLPTDRWLSKDEAVAANPRQWWYDARGKEVKYEFANVEVPKEYNLGPDKVDYVQWYDDTGTAKEYAPKSTALIPGRYTDRTQAPNSPYYKPPKALNEVASSATAGGTVDMEVQSNLTGKRRRKDQLGSLSLLGDSDTMSSSDGKTLLGD